MGGATPTKGSLAKGLFFRVEFYAAASQDAGNGRRKCSKRALACGKLERPSKSLKQSVGEIWMRV